MFEHLVLYYYFFSLQCEHCYGLVKAVDRRLIIMYWLAAKVVIRKPELDQQLFVIYLLNRNTL